MKQSELYQIYFSEFTARFCTWAVISQLLVHFIHIHWQTSAQQLYVVGVSISLLYISAIFGGLIRDYLFESQIVIMLGIGLISLGSLLLFSHTTFFYLGLSLTLLGAGMVTPNTPLLLSSFVDTNHENVFTILYGVTNAGVILGSILSGFVQTYFSWKGVLILNEIMIVIWLGGCAVNAWLSIFKKINAVKLITFFSILIFTGLITYFYLMFKSVAEISLIIAGLIYFSFLIYVVLKNPSIKKQLAFIIFLTAAAIIFFSGEFQVASTLVDYANNFANLNFAHIKIPPGSLLAFESIFVVLGAFIIARIKSLSVVTHVQTKVYVGLLLGAFAFVILYFSTMAAAHNDISVWWIVLAFLFLGLGDVYLMPPVMAYVAKNAPLKYKGRLMAGMYFSLSLSGYFSGLIGSTLSKYFTDPNTNLHFYSTGFGVMIFILGVAAILVFITRIIEAIFYSKHSR